MAKTKKKTKHKARKKAPSAAQLAARQRFIEMVRGKVKSAKKRIFSTKKKGSPVAKTKSSKGKSTTRRQGFTFTGKFKYLKPFAKALAVGTGYVSARIFSNAVDAGVQRFTSYGPVNDFVKSGFEGGAAFVTQWATGKTRSGAIRDIGENIATGMALPSVLRIADRTGISQGINSAVTGFINAGGQSSGTVPLALNGRARPQVASAPRQSGTNWQQLIGTVVDQFGRAIGTPGTAMAGLDDDGGRPLPMLTDRSGLMGDTDLPMTQDRSGLYGDGELLEV